MTRTPCQVTSFLNLVRLDMIYKIQSCYLTRINLLSHILLDLQRFGIILQGACIYAYIHLWIQECIFNSIECIYNYFIHVQLARGSSCLLL